MEKLAPPQPLPDPAFLEELACTRMPFGKYAGRLLLDLPEPYVMWFHRQGGLHGRLGQLFSCLVEIKVNGLEPLLEPLRPRDPPTPPAPPGRTAGAGPRRGR